jgi:hypothetical protein
LCTDLGYYYKDNDVNDGARRVVEAIDQHDSQLAQYRDKQRSLIARYLPDHAALVGGYTGLLHALIKKPLR